MNIHERQSLEPEYTWQHFNFFTRRGVWSGSSLFVLLRHQKDIAGSRPLLALGVADMGVVLSIAWRTVAYSTTGYSQQTLTAEWICLYWYYCSICFTILLSVDRCLSSAYPMLLLKINYTKLQRRIIAAAFPAVCLITLPHLLGFTVTYHHGSHSMIIAPCNFFSKMRYAIFFLTECLQRKKFHGRYCSAATLVTGRFSPLLMF